MKSRRQINSDVMEPRSNNMIPVSVLVCHSNPRAVTQLVRVLEDRKDISLVRVAATLREAQICALSTELQLIFMDLFLLDDTQFIGNYLSYNVEHAADFILTIRKLLPKTIFVLYTSVASLKFYGPQIFRGPRARLSHYYVLDDGRPRLPTRDERPYIEMEYQHACNSGDFGLIDSAKYESPRSGFAARVWQLIDTCQSDLKATLSESELSHIQWRAHVQEEAPRIQDAKPLRRDATVIRPDLFRALSNLAGQVFLLSRDQVFLSYAFDHESLATKITSFLESNGFSVVSGRQSRKFIGDDVVQLIAESEFFLCIITRGDEKADGAFAPRPWLLEEKGIAIAYRKNIVLMVEKGVEGFGELQADLQRIYFTRGGFRSSANRVLEALRAYQNDLKLSAKGN